MSFSRYYIYCYNKYRIMQPAANTLRMYDSVFPAYGQDTYSYVINDLHNAYVMLQNEYLNSSVLSLK